ncbi:MAG: hypothetical protein Q7T20_15920 [Saprospiraceae bacterium]|nr:hypothetical protein [Saprospiraceae bacterium]
MQQILRFSLLLVLISISINQIQAQLDPTLSIQGILKKANGVAVEDGTYNVTFKLYEMETGGTAIWMETQPALEVSSGIYSATLGANPAFPLNVAFNTLYYLGVTVGSAELSPRILLTSAPYALSLIGQSNKFPSAGLVQADSITLKGGVKARGGAPGLNGIDKNGYAFKGNSGDNDSGMFSTADGKVALYANNTEMLEVTGTNVEINTNLTVGGGTTTNGLAINNNGNVSYNGLNGWRLVDVDDFIGGGSEGWQVSQRPQGSNSCAWSNGSISGATPADFGMFAGKGIVITNVGEVFKKQFNIPGSFNMVKIKFRYFFIDTWQIHDQEKAWAGFATDYAGGNLAIGWALSNAFFSTWATGDQCANGSSLQQRSDFFGNADQGDMWMDVEMTAIHSDNNIHVYFGSGLDESIANERFGVGLVEIWVR